MRNSTLCAVPPSPSGLHAHNSITHPSSVQLNTSQHLQAHTHAQRLQLHGQFPGLSSPMKQIAEEGTTFELDEEAVLWESAGAATATSPAAPPVVHSSANSDEECNDDGGVTSEEEEEDVFALQEDGACLSELAMCSQCRILVTCTPCGPPCRAQGQTAAVLRAAARSMSWARP